MALRVALALAGLAAALAFTDTPAWQAFCLSADACVPTTACQNRILAGGWVGRPSSSQLRRALAALSQQLTWARRAGGVPGPHRPHPVLGALVAPGAPRALANP